MNGHFASGGAHGDAQVPGGQRRRVVDAVANNRDAVAFGFDLPDEIDFVLRQAFAQAFFAADLARDAGRAPGRMKHVADLDQVGFQCK